MVHVGIKFPNIDKFFGSFLKKFTRSIDKAMSETAQQVAKNIDLSYENRGFLDPNSPRKGFIQWIPTSRAAKRARKNYPKGDPPQGKRFTQSQAQYLFAAPSLEDTGALRASIGIDGPFKSNDVTNVFVGAGKDYIQIHEEGGNVNVEGKSFDVPKRPSQHITEPEADDLEQIWEKILNA